MGEDARKLAAAGVSMNDSMRTRYHMNAHTQPVHTVPNRQFLYRSLRMVQGKKSEKLEKAEMSSGFAP